MAKEIKRRTGLYKNGSKWWMRVLGEPRSTGTSDLVLANRVAAMVEELVDGNGQARDWLDRVTSRDVTLADLYLHRSSGTLHELKGRLKVQAATDDDPDLDPIVDLWIADHLPTLDIAPDTRAEYARQVRLLIPAGVRFPASTFTEDTLKRALHALTDARTGERLSGSTLRRFTVAWKLFWRFARKRVTLANPFDDPDWIPANGSPRSIWWDHETVLKVLGKMEGEHKVAMALVFGSGMEHGALLAMEGRDVGPTPADERTLPTVVAHGTKNDTREDRTIFVNRWAWDIVRAHADGKRSREKLFTTLGAEGKLLRDAFYRAQVAAGLIEMPARKDKAGKPRWGEVEPHNIHDARHTYCIVRLLGLDGEPRQSLKFCSMQLGHADEQMVMRIYSKANIEQRLRMIELAEARRSAA